MGTTTIAALLAEAIATARDAAAALVAARNARSDDATIDRLLQVSRETERRVGELTS